MWLIVGLGNPGNEYAWTPHNFGFLVVDRLAERFANAPEPPMLERRLVDYLKRLGRHRFQAPKWRPEARSYVRPLTFLGNQIVLAKPQTYMNLSGAAVAELAERYEAVAGDVIVVVDDVALPWGTLRIREHGSAGGHNGLKSIIGALGSDQFPRVRIGIKPEHPVADLASYVLSAIRKSERDAAAAMVEAAADAVEMILGDGLLQAMNRFNRKVE